MKKTLLACIILIFGCANFAKAQCYGQVQIDLPSHVNFNGASTFNITTANPNELIMLAYNGWFGPGAGPITVDGNPATQIAVAHTSNDAGAAIWAYSAPAAGSHTIVCSESGYNSPYFLNFAVAFYATGTCTPLSIGSIISNTSATASGTTVTCSVTTTTSNAMIFDSYVYNTGIVPAVSLIQSGSSGLDSLHEGNGIDAADGYTNAPVAGPYTVNTSDVNSCCGGCICMAAIIPPLCGGALTLNTSIANPKCSSAIDTASVSVTGGVGPYTYSWAPSGNTTDTVYNLSTGTYTVTVKDAAGCTSTTSVTITASSLTVNANVTANEACNGDAIGSATSSASGGTAPYTYSWSNAQTSSNVSALTAGTYTITITDNGGCSGTASINITQPAALAPNFTINNISCNGGANGSISSAPSGGNPGYTYSWSPIASTNSSISNLSVGTYTLSLTDANGCNVTASASITQPAAPLSNNFSTVGATCNSSNGSATDTVQGGTPAYSYSWSNGETSSTATGLSAGSYTVTATDAHGCSISVNVNVGNTGAETVSISNSTNLLCFGDNNGSINTNTTGGTSPYTFSWNSGQTTSNITGLTAGSYTITVTDANGCVSTASATVTQPTALNDNPSVVNVTCNGQSDGSASLSTSGGTNPYTYNWSNGATTSSNTGLTAGTYTVTIQDANGCNVTASVTITQPTAINPIITGNDSICFGNSTTLTAGSAGSYVWNTGATTSSITVNPSTTTTYTVIQSSGACKDTVKFTVFVSPQLILSMKLFDTICMGKSTQVSVTVISGDAPYTYQWNHGLANGPGPYTVSPSSSTYYTCTVTDACGDKVSDSTLVVVLPSPVAAFVPTPDTIAGGQSITFIDNSLNANNWYWTFGDGNTSNAQNPSNQYMGGGDYNVTLLVTNSFGCRDSAVRQVVVTDLFSVPNIFTPNNDGINDVFKVSASLMKTYSISIYDRWGKLVYTSTDQNTSWTGVNKNGVAESAGTYYYYINAADFSDKTFNQKGFVQLLR